MHYEEDLDADSDEYVAKVEYEQPKAPLESAPAWRRLISHTLLPHEVISLIEEIFTNKEEVQTICDLLGSDAQIFINTIHEVRFEFLPSRDTI